MSLKLNKRVDVFVPNGFITRKDEDSNDYEFVISDPSKDVYRTVIKSDAWDLTHYRKNPIVLYNHLRGNDWHDKPTPDNIIGKGEVFQDGEKLIGRVEFEPEDINPLAEKIRKKVDFGTIRGVSVGFVPKEGHRGVEEHGEDPNIFYFTRVELKEFSIVDIPANPNAVKRSAFFNEVDEFLNSGVQQNLNTSNQNNINMPNTIDYNSPASLRDEARRIDTEAKALVDLAGKENRVFSQEEETKFDRMHEDAERFKRQAERIEKLNSENGQRVLRENENNVNEGRSWNSSYTQDNADVEKRVFETVLRVGPDNLDSQERAIYNQMKKRALGSGTGSTGGFVVPEGFQRELEKAVIDEGGVIEIMRNIPTSDGADIPWPSVNDTGNTGEMIGENQEVDEQDPSFGSKTLKSYIFSSKKVKVPLSLIEDSAFDLQSEITMMLGERIYRTLGVKLIDGTGSDQPEGLNKVPTGFTAGATAISDTDLLDLMHSVNSKYRKKSHFAFADSTLLALKKLKIGSNDDNPLWVPSMRDGEPDKIYGKPYVIDDNISAIGTGNSSIYFGDFSKFILRTVRSGVTMMRLNELYAESLQAGFIAFARYDSRLIDAGTNPLKKLVHS
ncbi:phage major capsid protein [Flammeovirga sp. OC4]|uniref:phage major capsid protein n=1 Tax=Flammeovirga sp. OC4 TaxID=1382345 RepID=UPI0006943B46|nr:phage major capsid protein [Flammeovirga sp. OC4]